MCFHKQVSKGNNKITELRTTITVYRMSTWHKNTTSERGVFFPQVTQDDTLILYTVIVVNIQNLAEIQYPNSWYSVKNNEAWLKVHFYKESELQKHLVLLADGYYSSAKRIPHRGEKAHEGTQE